EPPDSRGDEAHVAHASSAPRTPRGPSERTSDRRAQPRRNRQSGKAADGNGLVDRRKDTAAETRRRRSGPEALIIPPPHFADSRYAGGSDRADGSSCFHAPSRGNAGCPA